MVHPRFTCVLVRVTEEHVAASSGQRLAASVRDMAACMREQPISPGRRTLSWPSSRSEQRGRFSRKARRLLDEIGSAHLKVTIDPRISSTRGTARMRRCSMRLLRSSVRTSCWLTPKISTTTGTRAQGRRPWRARLRPVRGLVTRLSLQRAAPASRIEQRTSAGLRGFPTREAGPIAPSSSITGGLSTSGESWARPGDWQRPTQWAVNLVARQPDRCATITIRPPCGRVDRGALGRLWGVIPSGKASRTDASESTAPTIFSMSGDLVVLRCYSSV